MKLVPLFINVLMKKNPFILEGDIPKMPSHEIYLNVNALEKGNYELKIISKNKLIKKTTFRKK